jgi:putative ATP-grasp target RiPP
MAETLVPTSFSHDPIAPHSAQFPLGGVGVPADGGRPSPARVRPWGLRGMRTARVQGDPVRAVFRYDHASQTAVDGSGRQLVAADPTANKVSTNDGDEGPSEDFTYDFCPDDPFRA